MKCEYFNNDACKSCDLLGYDYASSLLFKEHELKQLFPDILIKPTVGLTSEIAGSRNKAKFAVFNHHNKLEFGFTHSDGTYQELEQCPLHAVGINKILPGLREILNKFNIVPYDVKAKSGELKYLLISTSGENEAQEILLRFVLRSKKSLPDLKLALTDILSLSPTIKVISANLQPIHQAVLEGDEEIVLTATKYISHHFDEFKLILGTRSFFQVTSTIAQCLYNAAAQAIKSDAPTSLLDLYCGVGAFSFYASRHCQDVTGVEISREAIECAKQTAQLNKKSIRFESLDVSSYLDQVDKQFDAIIINPPRRGLNSSIISKIKNIAPRFIYYSSCNAKTLQRDFAEMNDLYSIGSLQIFDMFPYTKHYETLMCLHLK